MNDNVIHIDRDHKDAIFWSVEQVLEDALSDIRAGKSKAKKCLVILLDDNDGNYDVRYVQAGMRSSQCIGLLAVTQRIFLDGMGY